MGLHLASAFLSALVVPALALPSTSSQNNHVVHEKRDIIQSRWVRSNGLDPNHIIPARIGLTQNNLELGVDYLYAISDPNSPKYGNHYTIDEVTNLFAPSAATVEIVKSWIVDSGIPKERISQSTNKAWLQFDASIYEMEQLFQTKYHYYEHIDGGPKHISCEDYKVPVMLSEHIDYITPGVKPLAVRAMGDIMKRNLASLQTPRPVRKSISDDVLAVREDADILANCSSLVTPACIRAMYQIPVGKLSDPTNSLGIFSQVSTYSQDDLDLFYASYSPNIPKGTHPVLASIDGATAPVTDPNNSGYEAMIDFEMAYPIVYPQTTTDYQTGGTQYQNTNLQGIFNSFLDAIDGSYCTYTYANETGDDPNVDPQDPGGKHDCGTLKPTNVISLSYGWYESHYPVNYMIRQCNEFMKLALQGVTVLAASGDTGPTDGGGCLGPGHNITSPTFPSCPYITLVGATELIPGMSTGFLEGASATGIVSGGGFSNVFAQPSFQANAVNSFLTNYNPPFQSYSTVNGTIPTNGGVYNRIGRAYPDLAAVGNNGAMVYINENYTGDGTSMSTPIVAAIFTRINDERLAVGKKPVGWVNPTLYANPQMFNDITIGNQSRVACGTNVFFSCTPGWDPVTGLGTPKYDAMLKVFMALP